MIKRILLTGATGFLGSHLAKAMIDHGYEVVALKRKSSSTKKIQSLTHNFELIDVDDLDLNDFFKATKKIDAIIHTATCYGHNMLQCG